MKSEHIVLAIIGTIVILGIFGGISMPWGYGMMGYYGFGMILFGWLIGILVIMALILLILWLVQQIDNNRKGGGR
ncbi:hypothetical protein J4461_02875 [Candidatus Pacearchaeota archaeon]|nr:hypothetical protein [Candidatus Pacearchaeota archaeon]